MSQEQRRGREKRKCENLGPLRRKESTEDEASSRLAGELQLTQWMEKMGNDRLMYCMDKNNVLATGRGPSLVSGQLRQEVSRQPRQRQQEMSWKGLAVVDVLVVVFGSGLTGTQHVSNVRGKV